MIRAAAIVFALTTTAGAQSQGDTARAQIKAQLEGVRAPMFSGGQTLSGVTATYSAMTTGCRSRIDISLPSHMVGTTSHPARTEQVTLEWMGVQSVTISDAYVIVAAPGLSGGKRYFYAGSGPGATRLKANMDTLAGVCASPAANTAPTNIPAVSERVPEKADILGTPQCRFRQVPELLLTDNKPPVVKRALYKILPRETGGKETRFAIGAQSGEQAATWEGILADPQIVLDSEAHRAAKITRAAITIDGRPLAIPVVVSHDANKYPGSIPGKFYTDASVNSASYNPGGLLTEIARGSNMVVRLYAGDREISYWTFDVSRLRYAPAALKGARWTCK